MEYGSPRDERSEFYAVAVAHLAERRSVAAEAAGSIPVSHPRLSYSLTSVQDFYIIRPW